MEDLRYWIDLSESSRHRVLPMSRPFKPFSQVTKEDVVRAFFDIDDISGFMENQWDQIDWDDGIDAPPRPTSSVELTPDQIKKVIEWYQQGRSDAWADVWDALTPIANLEHVPVTRRLNRLSDLTQSLGIHWSYGTSPWPGMESYGAHVAYGVVPNGNIDWVCTAARAINSWSSEGEISVLPGTGIVLTKIEFGPGTRIKA